MARSVVLDTNVIVSAHLKEEGLERFVLDLALAHKIQVFISTEVFTEYCNVLSRSKFRIKPDRVATSLALIEKAAIKVMPKQRLIAAKDPDDNKFLECASESQADYLVTGNKRHFPTIWGPTRIVNARELLEEIAPDLRVN